MWARKVLECCKQTVVYDLEVQNNRELKEMQKLEDCFIKFQKGTRFLQGIKQQTTFVIFWKKRYLCLVQ